MAEQGKTEQEPSIEEILASIRQIISDDDEGGGSKEAPHTPAVAAAEPAEEDVIELVDRVEEEENNYSVETAPQPSFRQEMAAVQQQQPVPRPAPKPAPVVSEPEGLEVAMNDISARLNADTEVDSVFSDLATSAALDAFSELATRTAIDRSSGVTIEDIVREMMKPMLRAWIDKHVPKIVERLLQQELERISKRAMED